MAFWKKSLQSSESITVDEKQWETGEQSHPIEEDLLRRFGRIRSALSPGTVIQGKLSFDSPVRIDGKLSGEVFSSQTLLIGPDGLVDADLEADTIVVLGKVAGTIKARQRVEFMPGSEAEGEIISPILVVHEGARVQGSSDMGIRASERRVPRIERRKKA